MHRGIPRGIPASGVLMNGAPSRPEPLGSNTSAGIPVTGSAGADLGFVTGFLSSRGGGETQRSRPRWLGRLSSQRAGEPKDPALSESSLDMHQLIRYAGT